ncbi:MAG: hypothetical protein ACREXX_20850, partial [Gammaproteobacteria bacterium]
KLATLTEPVGIVDRDRFSGIRARFGAEIPTIPVTQDTTAIGNLVENLSLGYGILFPENRDDRIWRCRCRLKPTGLGPTPSRSTSLPLGA